ncbi:MAG: hypothetical protein JO257_25345 [Deltaproteobacteria bacterium]|nr:hypothetical protein [Deltaproteobacteria bacterium]
MALRTPLIVSLALALFGGAARADKVDWSQYIDHDAKPTAPAPAATPTAEPAPAPTKTKAQKRVAAKPKAKAKSKARRRH